MELKDWYTIDEVSPMALRGMRRQIDPKQRRILDFAEIDDDNDERIERDIYIQDDRQLANIRGFTDPSIKMQGLETETKIVQPFHIRNHFEFGNDSQYARKQGGGWEVSAAGMRHGQETVLEPARLNLYVYALLSMINDRQFSYEEEELGALTIDYANHIAQLPNPNDWLGSGNFDAYVELRAIKQAYYNRTGQLPNLVFMGPTVGGDFTQLPEVEAKYQPQQPSDPDPSERTFEEFTFFGMTFVILYDQYPDVTGTLHPAIKDKHMVVTTSEVAGVGGPPMVLRKAQNEENENDASEPYYEMKQISNDPWASGEFLYDNVIPDVKKKDIVANWKVKS